MRAVLAAAVAVVIVACGEASPETAARPEVSPTVLTTVVVATPTPAPPTPTPAPLAATPTQPVPPQAVAPAVSRPAPAVPPQPTPEPSALSRWTDCYSTWNQGVEVETVKQMLPGSWSSDYQRLWDSLVGFDKGSCAGVGAALARTDGAAHCVDMLSAAASQRAYLRIYRGLLDWYFPQRQLQELDGYTAAAGC